jgi:hypothetical protein
VSCRPSSAFPTVLVKIDIVAHSLWHHLGAWACDMRTADPRQALGPASPVTFVLCPDEQTRGQRGQRICWQTSPRAEPRLEPSSPDSPHTGWAFPQLACALCPPPQSHCRVEWVRMWGVQHGSGCACAHSCPKVPAQLDHLPSMDTQESQPPERHLHHLDSVAKALISGPG